MIGQKLTKRVPYGLVLFLALAGGPAAVAGGFYVSLEPPTFQTDARLKDAILIARAGGCIDPAQAVLRATAEGLVNGHRKSIPVQLTPAGPGVYAVKRQWPATGTWMLAIAGEATKTPGGMPMRCSLLVAVGQEGQVEAGRPPDAQRIGSSFPVQTVYRAFTVKEIEMALQKLARQTAKNQSASRSAP